jgi:hypothetical protein
MPVQLRFGFATSTDLSLFSFVPIIGILDLSFVRSFQTAFPDGGTRQKAKVILLG